MPSLMKCASAWNQLRTIKTLDAPDTQKPHERIAPSCGAFLISRYQRHGNAAARVGRNVTIGDHLLKQCRRRVPVHEQMVLQVKYAGLAARGGNKLLGFRVHVRIEISHRENEPSKATLNKPS